MLKASRFGQALMRFLIRIGVYSVIVASIAVTMLVWGSFIFLLASLLRSFM